MSEQYAEPSRTADYFAWFPPMPREEVRERLLAGCVVVANSYRGRVKVWKDAAGYRVRVSQYATITEDERFDDPDAAIKAFWKVAAEL